MKTAGLVLAALALTTLSACSGDWTTPGEPCPGFQGFPEDDLRITCGDDVFEEIGLSIAWREIPESGTCPEASCFAIEIVTNWACPRVELDFAKGTKPRDGQLPDGALGDISNAKPGVRYTLRYVSDQESVSSKPQSAQCWFPD